MAIVVSSRVSVKCECSLWSAQIVHCIFPYFSVWTHFTHSNYWGFSPEVYDLMKPLICRKNLCRLNNLLAAHLCCRARDVFCSKICFQCPCLRGFKFPRHMPNVGAEFGFQTVCDSTNKLRKSTVWAIKMKTTPEYRFHISASYIRKTHNRVQKVQFKMGGWRGFGEKTKLDRVKKKSWAVGTELKAETEKRLPVGIGNWWSSTRAKVSSVTGRKDQKARPLTSDQRKFTAHLLRRV